MFSHMMIPRGWLGGLTFLTLTVASIPVKAQNEREIDLSVSLPSTLSLAKAIEIARTHGLEVLSAEASITDAEGNRAIAGAVANPSINGAVARSFLYSPDNVSCPGGGCTPWGWLTSVSDNGAISEIVFGKRNARVNVAEAALKATKLSRLDAIRTLEFLAKRQYLLVAYAKNFHEFSLEVKAVYDQVHALTLIRYNAGAISESDLAKANTARLESEQDVTGAEQEVIVSKAGLAYLLGARNRTDSFVIDHDALRYSVPPKLAKPDVTELIDLAFKHRPDYLSNRAQIQAAEAKIQSANKLKIPAVALNLQANGQGQGNYALQPPTVTMGLSLPIPVVYQYQGEVRKAQADLRAQSIQDAKLRAQIVADVQASYASFIASKQKVVRMENELLESAKRARDLVKIQYEKGAASLLEFLDAQRTWIANNLEYLQNSTSYWTSVFQLEQAVGMELRQ